MGLGCQRHEPAASPPQKRHGTEALIPQSLQLQAQVTSAIVVWCHKSGEWVKSCARGDKCVSAVIAVEMSVLVFLRSSWNHATEVGGPWGLWDSRWRLSCKMTKCRGFCRCNLAIPILQEAGWASGPVWKSVMHIAPNLGYFWHTEMGIGK
jgi:hypothetical protein